MEDRFFFNPYGFYGGFNNAFPPNMAPPPNISQNPNAFSKMSPKEFYENQYFYYRYLNEAMDYQIKSQEFAERVNKMNNSKSV